MSTRSRIAVELPNGKIESIYCHFDGYTKFNGVKLKEHFNSYDKAKELISGGDISSLWTNLGFNQETLPETGPLYYSQRGEDCPPRLDDNRYDYLGDGEEYAYLYTLDDEWICYDRHEFGDRMPEIVEIPEPEPVN
jgi:hypothetical protein